MSPKAPPTIAYDFDQIVADYGGLIWRVAQSYERDGDLARDLYQDSLLAVWRALDRYRGDASIKTFIARIAHNRGITHAVRESAAPRRVPLNEDSPSTAATPEDSAATTVQRTKVLDAIIDLPLEWRPVITLTLEGFNPHDIADVLGTNANIISIRLSRAKVRLQQILGA